MDKKMAMLNQLSREHFETIVADAGTAFEHAMARLQAQNPEALRTVHDRMKAGARPILTIDVGRSRLSWWLTDDVVTVKIADFEGADPGQSH